MKICLVRKVPYRVPGTNRLIFALVLKESEGLALLFCRATREDEANTLVIATENVQDRVFEPASTCQFPIEDSDLIPMANVYAAVAEGIQDARLRDLLSSEDIL
ncbi:MAG TPA: hypothetical protein PKM73_07540 [Verrucomicrobiota bacterium]|nr:hypothetical protein [Verrucomicrobiota bacterium]HNU51259.1 hypothetical protein [Verrucomicrobiota bacterium]